MKSKLLFSILLVTMISYAQSSGFGLGLVINDDFGISGKYWIDRTNAIDMNLNLAKNANVIGADYVWHRYDIIESNFPVYYGVGAKVALGDANGFGVNGVAGIAFLIRKIKIDVFVELVPTILLSPNSDFSMDWQLGGRYFF